MQIKCEKCGAIITITEKQLGKKGICPGCFQTIELSKEKEYRETLWETILRLKKRGNTPPQIFKKLIESGISLEDLIRIRESLKEIFSPQEFKEFAQEYNRALPQPVSVYSSLNLFQKKMLWFGWGLFLFSLFLPWFDQEIGWSLLWKIFIEVFNFKNFLYFFCVLLEWFGPVGIIFFILFFILFIVGFGLFILNCLLPFFLRESPKNSKFFHSYSILLLFILPFFLCFIYGYIYFLFFGYTTFIGRPLGMIAIFIENFPLLQIQIQFPFQFKLKSLILISLLLGTCFFFLARIRYFWLCEYPIALVGLLYLLHISKRWSDPKKLEEKRN